MRLEKAIEIQSEYIKDGAYEGTDEFMAALQLGIEALKRVKECGCPARCGLLERLPGETKE